MVMQPWMQINQSEGGMDWTASHSNHIAMTDNGTSVWQHTNWTGNLHTNSNDMSASDNRTDTFDSSLKINSSLSDTQIQILSTNVWPKTNLFMGYLLSSLAGIATSVRVTTLKRYSAGLDPDIFSLYTSFGSIIISTIGMLILEEPKWPENTHDCILLWVHSITIGLATFLAYKAQVKMSQTLYGLASSGFVVFSQIGQYTLLRDVNPGYGNVAEVSGIILVTLSVIMPFLTVPHCMKCQDRDDKEKINFVTYREN